MEGSLSQQDGTSEKVAVKTMKRELSVTHETHSSCGQLLHHMVLHEARMEFRDDDLGHQRLRRTSRVLPGYRETVSIMSSSHLPRPVLTLKSEHVIPSPSLPSPTPRPPLSLSLSRY